MELMLLFLYPCISVLVLYLLNVKYSYKLKIIKLLGSVFRYKALLAMIIFVEFACFLLFYDKTPFLSPVWSSSYFSFLYLAVIPRNL